MQLVVVRYNAHNSHVVMMLSKRQPRYRVSLCSTQPSAFGNVTVCTDRENQVSFMNTSLNPEGIRVLNTFQTNQR